MDNWELYYRTHAKGVGKELTGSPPLSFVSNGQPLSDYRIDGDSGGVGDRTKNLFDKNNSEMLVGLYISPTGKVLTTTQSKSIIIPCLPSTTYSIKCKPVYTLRWGSFSSYPSQGDVSKKVEAEDIESQHTSSSYTTSSNANYLIIFCYSIDTGDANRYSIKEFFGEVIVSKGQPADYEPYGYKIPIVCGGATTNIYLDEPLRKPSKLPTGYTQVEYIRSTGTQYIDTGIKTNTTTSRYETKINPSLVSGTIGIFGTRDYSSATPSSMNVFIIDGAFRLDWLKGANTTGVRISSNTEYTISITRGLATINNANYTSGDTTSIDGSYTFYVGSFNNVGSVYSNGFSGKIYYSKLYNNNILVFDGVPCYRKSDNEIGMYDLVSNTFFTNAGTGSFIAGAEVETVYYTDYIDYAAQKRHNSDGTESSVTLPEISTLAGTNTLTVLTEVQPSNMYIKYDGSGNVNQSLMKYLEYKYKVARNKED